MHTWLFPLLLSVTACLSISLQDAGVHDWHHPLLGQPLTESSLTSPRFHYPAGRTRSSVSALIYTATQRNVIGAVEPRRGELVWRQVFPGDQHILKYVLHDDYLLALTGPAASNLHLFSASSGHALWSINQHDNSIGLLPEPGSIAADAVFYHYSGQDTTLFDVISLSNGKDVRRVNGKTGEVVWHYSLDKSEDPTLQLHAILPPASSAQDVQVLLIQRQIGSYALLVLSIKLENGQPSDTKPIAIKGASLSSLTSIHTFLPIARATAGHAIFLDTAGSARALVISTENKPSLISLKSTGRTSNKFAKLSGVDLDGRGVIVAERSDRTSAILQVDINGDLVFLFDWTDSVEDPLYSGFIDRDGKAHISRYYISRVLGMASMSTYSLEASEHSEAGTVYASTFNYSPAKHGRMLHVTAEIAPRQASGLLTRLCVTTAGGAVQGWLGSTLQWGRPEGLAHISSSKIGSAEIHMAVSFFAVSKTNSSTEPDELGLFNPLSLYSHAVNLLPLSAILTRIGLSKPDTSLSTTIGRDWLSDAFGYRKIVLVGSDFGKIYAIDLGDGGKVLWEHHLLPLNSGPADKGWQRVSWKKLAVFDQREDGRVLVVAVAEVQNTANEIYTLAHYLDGMTGLNFDRRSALQEVISRGPIQNALVLHGSSQPTLMLVGHDNKIHLHSPPQSLLSGGQLSESLPRLTALDTSETNNVKGLHAMLSSGANPVAADIAWQFSLSLTERVVALHKQTNGKIASLGRVLGDRSTLYKYLNPHMLAIASVDDTAASAFIYLIDGVTGAILWTASHIGTVDTVSGVSVSLTENWLAYSFSDTEADGKQTRLVSVEFFERARSKADATRTTFTSYDARKPLAVSRAFIFPGAITSLATSQTLHGVTTKALLVGTNSEQIVAVPRRFLDPRRPVGKRSKADMEEFLIQYEPVIPVDAKWIVSHRNRISGLRHIMTSATILESTSQVFAFGLDLFGTSVSPSGRFDVLSREFNKLQLIATTLGLLGAIAIMKPIVQKKQLKERWYPAT